MPATCDSLVGCALERAHFAARLVSVTPDIELKLTARVPLLDIISAQVSLEEFD